MLKSSQIHVKSIDFHASSQTLTWLRCNHTRKIAQCKTERHYLFTSDHVRDNSNLMVYRQYSPPAHNHSTATSMYSQKFIKFIIKIHPLTGKHIVQLLSISSQMSKWKLCDEWATPKLSFLSYAYLVVINERISHRWHLDKWQDRTKYVHRINTNDDSTCFLIRFVFFRTIISSDTVIMQRYLHHYSQIIFRRLSTDRTCKWHRDGLHRPLLSNAATFKNRNIFIM